MTLRKLIREFSTKFIDVHDIDWSAKEGRVFLNLNLFGMYLLLTDLGFVSSLRRADYIHIDGIGAAFLIKVILGISYKPIGYRKWGHVLLEQSEHHGVIFIGGTQRESELAICRVRQQYNITNIQGCDGYLDRPKYTKFINDSSSKIVVVGMGMPQQEALIVSLMQAYPDRWYFSCGGWIKQLAGLEAETPGWVIKLKLEWLHRSIGRKDHFFQRVLRPLVCIIKNF